MHVVGILVPDGVDAFDIAAGAQTFASVQLPNGTPGYEIRICGNPTVALANGQPCFDLRPPWPPATLTTADTVLVPGAANLFDPDPQLIELVRAAAAGGARIATICTGAFLLAATGLLDGMRATTHWSRCAELADRYPAVRVDPMVLFVDNDSLLTSAGGAAGLDLCLHLIRRDYGSAVATATARYAVMPPQRDADQAQYIPRQVPPQDADALQPVLEWLEHNLSRPLTLSDIAAHAGLSVRTLQRRFRTQLGTTTQRWLLTARLQRARDLLETTALPMDRVAEAAGFGSVAALRLHFTRHVGAPPRDYRKNHGGRSASGNDPGWVRSGIWQFGSE